MTLTKDDFLRDPPVQMPAEVVRSIFQSRDLVHALGVSRSALSRYSDPRKKGDYAYIPSVYSRALFKLAETKHVDLLGAINEWMEQQPKADAG